MNRTRKSAWSIASALLFIVVSVSTGLMATPWLLYWLGSERFGAFKVLTDWISYLALLEMGLGGALMASLALKVGRGAAPAVQSTLAAGLQIYLQLTFAMIAGGVGLVLALPYLISLETISPYEIRVAGLISLLAVLTTPLLVFRSLAEARQRNYIFNILMTAQTLIATLLWLVVARAGWGLIGLSLVAVASQIPTALILMWDGMRGYVGLWSTSPDPATKKALLTLSRNTFIHGITDRIGLISDNVIIASILGPAAVVPFYLTQQLGVIVQFLLRSFSNATWAGLVELYCQGQSTVFRARLVELTSTVSGLGVVFLGPIVAYNHHFIRQWVGPATYAGEAVTVIACINIWGWSIYSAWGWPLLGTGQIGRWVPYAIVSTVVNVNISAFATLRLGLIGPLLGTLTGFLIVNSWALPRILKQTFKISPCQIWRAALTPLTWGLLYTVILWLIARTHNPWGWFGLATEMASAGLCGLALWWTLGLSQDARTQWRHRIRNVLAV